MTSGSGTATTTCSPTRCARGSSAQRSGPGRRAAPGRQPVVRRARQARRRGPARVGRRRRRARGRPRRARPARAAPAAPGPHPARWLQALPDDVRAPASLLATDLAWTRLSEGDLDGVEAWLDAAEAGARGRPRRRPAPVRRGAAGRGRAARDARAARACRPRSRSTAPRSPRRAATSTARSTHARSALDLAGPDDHLARGAAAGLPRPGGLGRRRPRRRRSTRSPRRCAACTRPATSPTSSARPSSWPACGWPAAAPTRRDGSTSSALGRRRRAPGPPLSTTGDLHVGLADVLREQGELDAAEEHLRDGARSWASGRRCSENRHRWYAAMAGLLRAQRRPRGRGRDARAGRAALPARASSPTCAPSRPRGRGSGSPAAGSRTPGSWAREHGVAPDDDAPTDLAEFDQLTLARLLIAQHRSDDRRRLDDVAHLLDRVLEAARRGGPRRQRRRGPAGAGARPPTPRRRRRGARPTSARPSRRGPGRLPPAVPRRGRADGGAAPGGSTRRPGSRGCGTAPTAAAQRAAATGPGPPARPGGPRRRGPQRPGAGGAAAARDRPDRAGDRRSGCSCRSTRCAPTPSTSSPSST